MPIRVISSLKIWKQRYVWTPLEVLGVITLFIATVVEHHHVIWGDCFTTIISLVVCVESIAAQMLLFFTLFTLPRSRSIFQYTSFVRFTSVVFDSFSFVLCALTTWLFRCCTYYYNGKFYFTLFLYGLLYLWLISWLLGQHGTRFWRGDVDDVFFDKLLI